MLFCGDFNSRTGEQDDFVLDDNRVPLFHEFRDFFRETVTTSRKSNDKTINSYGRELLNFCKSYGVSIVNGRLGQDAGKGEYTYICSAGCSVIDYFLSSITPFDCIIDCY